MDPNDTDARVGITYNAGWKEPFGGQLDQFEIYDANLRLAMPLFDGGRRWASRSLAKATVREVESNRQMIQISTIEQVTAIYLSIRQAADQNHRDAQYRLGCSPRE